MGIFNINYFSVISIGLWLFLFVYWLIRSKSNGILNEITGLMKLFLSGLVLFVFEYLPFNFLKIRPFLIIKIIGMIMNISGLILCILGREYLKLNWSGKVIIQEKHSLIKKGPYRIIRHPIYSGVLVMMLGSSAVTGSIICFIWTLFCFFGLFRKSKQEEKLLIEKFGKEYEEYMKVTKGIIPYIL